VPEALRRSLERTSLGLLPELKRRNRARNQPPLIGPKKIGKAVWNTTRMLSVVFEVIQPDLEVNRRHAAALLIPPTGKQCASRFGQFCGGIRANSGSSEELIKRLAIERSSAPAIHRI
jgi:hypothetical protein